MIYTFSIQRLSYYAKISMVKLANLYWYNERHDIECRRTITRFGRVPPRSERTHGSSFGNGTASAQAAHARSSQGGGGGKCRNQTDLVTTYRTGARRVRIQQCIRPHARNVAFTPSH